MCRAKTVLLTLSFVLLSTGTAFAQKGASCSSDEATALFRKGFSAAEDRDSDRAMRHFQACLDTEPDCIPCLYELGWVYWTRGSWKSCVESWEKVLEIETFITSVPEAEEEGQGA